MDEIDPQLERDIDYMLQVHGPALVLKALQKVLHRLYNRTQVQFVGRWCWKSPADEILTPVVDGIEKEKVVA